MEIWKFEDASPFENFPPADHVIRVMLNLVQHLFCYKSEIAIRDPELCAAISSG
jgi:hypothetical protein